MIDLQILKNSINQRIIKLNPSSYQQIIPTSKQKEYIKEANLLINKDFKFDRRWDMERCATIYHLDIVDYETINNDDPEWNFMLNRMDWLEYLVLAGIITKDQKYLLKAKEYILTWIDQHPKIINQNSTRTLDTGIRLFNWLNCIIYLSWAELISDEELVLIANNMDQQVSYLYENYIPKYQLSNWGSIQTCNILIVLPFLHNDLERNKIYQWATKELQTQLKLQVLDDGMDWEQSPMYHIELLLSLQHILFFYSESPLRKPILENIKKMSNALQLIVTPHHLLPNFGDSDQVAPADVLANSAYLLNDTTLNYFGDFAFENILLIGQNVKQYQQLASEKPNKNNFIGKFSGNYAIRSSWNTDANYMFFNNGSMGSGHGHADNLHLSIYGRGIPLLVDSGRFTYREDHPTRVLLKSMKAHNVSLIDDYQPAKPNSSWDYENYYQVLPTYYCQQDGLHYLEGIVVGQNPLQVWTRKVFMLDCGAWIISDEIKITGNHEFKQLWHLHPQVKYSNGNISVDNKNWSIHADGEIEEEEFPFSNKYNQLSKSKLLIIKHKFEDKISFSTVINDQDVKVEKIPIRQNLTTPVKDEVAEGWRITSKKHQYDIALFHQEIFTGKKIFSIDDIPFHHQAFAAIDKTGYSVKG